MFGITTAASFFDKVRADHAELVRDTASPGAAMNCILSLYHLHEWVWSRWLKGRFDAQAALRIRNDKNEFVRWLDGNCPHFGLLQELANGTKHCVPVHSTDRVAGYGQGPYGIGPYGAPYLLIDMGDRLDTSNRYLVGDSVLTEILDFWERFFAAQAVS